MPYQLDDEKGTVSKNLTSFLFLMRFKLDDQGRIELMNDQDGGCYVAVLLDGPANAKLPPEVEEGERAGSYKLTIMHRSHGSIKFGDLSFVNCVKVHRNNEWAELRLYAGCGQDDLVSNPPSWIDTGGWNPSQHYKPVQPNHWDRTFSFGNITMSPIEESVVIKNYNQKARSVTLIRRLITGGSLCNIIRGRGSLNADDGDAIPELIFQCAAGGPSSLPDERFFTTTNVSNRLGFAMIAAGAFAGQDADTMIGRWNRVSMESVLDQLAEIAWAPKNAAQEGTGRRLMRKLYNIHNTDKTGSFAGTGVSEDPVEVLYVESRPDETVA